MRKLLIVLVFVLSAAACDDDDGGKPAGSEGGPCYGNGTCDADLVCDKDICVSQSTNNTNNVTTTNNTNSGTAGELGGPCLEGDVCNAQLVCHEQICKTDADEDGYHAGLDCDDNNENIFPGYIEECQSDCNIGVRSCMSTGRWSDCTAEQNCDCETPGDSRQVECGNCGWAMQNCNADFQWEFPGECQEEGECAAGATESEECGLCGERTRLCNAQCGWEEWTECTGEGVCEAGFEGWTTGDCSPLGQITLGTCDQNCQWVDIIPCTDQCQGQARTGTSDYKDEVCIPGGAFILGYEGDDWTDNEPVREIILTPFYIDVYEVTNDRYRECVNAGVCTPPAPPDAWKEDYYNDTTKGHYPVAFVSRDQATVFCNWDGGRSLPTEAQWEKAAKGPAPEQKIQPWGDDISATCTHSILRGCFPEGYPGPVDYPIDGLSYYGVFSMIGNVYEWVQDTYDSSYYGVAPYIDPVNETPLGSGLYRGSGFRDTFFEEALNLNFRGYASVGVQRDTLGFRCSRTGRE